MDPVTVGSIIMGSAALGSLISGTVQGAMNYKFSKENLKWQKQAQRTTWKREDTAIERRVADLRRSGLSPVLAAGQGASSGPIVSTTAPRIDLPDPQEKVAVLLSMLKMKEDISNTVADRYRIKKESELLGKKIVNQSIDNERNARDNFIEKVTGTHSSPSTPIKPLRDIDYYLQRMYRSLGIDQNSNGIKSKDVNKELKKSSESPNEEFNKKYNRGYPNYK